MTNPKIPPYPVWGPSALWNALQQFPPSPTATILTSILAQIVVKGIFDTSAIGLSLTKQPSSNIPADAYLTVTPGLETAISGQTFGNGRYAAGFNSIAWVNLYCRVALDRAYQDTYFLFGSTDGSVLGLRELMFSVTDALQLFFPLDAFGNLLTEEPIRMLGNPRTIKYERSGEWGFVSIPYEYRHAKPCNFSV